jgi:hypothetical protein
MIRGEGLEEQVYESQHIRQMLAEIERNFLRCSSLSMMLS